MTSDALRILTESFQKLFERYGPFNPFRNYGELARDLEKILSDRGVVILTRTEHRELIEDQRRFRLIRNFIEEYKTMKPEKAVERLKKNVKESKA